MTASVAILIGPYDRASVYGYDQHGRMMRQAITPYTFGASSFSRLPISRWRQIVDVATEAGLTVEQPLQEFRLDRHPSRGNRGSKVLTQVLQLPLAS